MAGSGILALLVVVSLATVVAFAPHTHILSPPSSHLPLTRHHAINIKQLPRPVKALFRKIFRFRPGKRRWFIQQQHDYQGLAVEKDMDLDSMRIDFSMRMERLRCPLLFEAFVEHALLNSGWQHGWDIETSNEEDTEGRIAALASIIEMRPIDQELDWKLRVLVDAHKKCCQDDRAFVDFYQGMWRELDKGEHWVVNICEPVYLTLPQEDFNCAMEMICKSLELSTERKPLGYFKAIDIDGDGVASWEDLERAGLKDHYMEILNQAVAEWKARQQANDAPQDKTVVG